MNMSMSLSRNLLNCRLFKHSVIRNSRYHSNREQEKEWLPTPPTPEELRGSRYIYVNKLKLTGKVVSPCFPIETVPGPPCVLKGADFFMVMGDTKYHVKVTTFHVPTALFALSKFEVGTHICVIGRLRTFKKKMGIIAFHASIIET